MAGIDEEAKGASSRILGSGSRRNGMESGMLVGNKPESATSHMGLESRLEPITQKTIDHYTPILFRIIYSIFQQ